MAIIWENIIKSLVGPVDVQNFDETGLFYRSTPTMTLARKGDDGAGAKRGLLCFYPLMEMGPRRKWFSQGNQKTQEKLIKRIGKAKILNITITAKLG